MTDDDLPPLPKPDRRGRFPALEYARALARDVVRDRRAADLTQRELADLAGTRQETISRIEGGKVTASHRLIDRIDMVFEEGPPETATRLRPINTPGSSRLPASRRITS